MTPRRQNGIIPRAARQGRKAEVRELDELMTMSPNPRFVEDCRGLLARMLPGDELVEFCTDKHLWGHGEGVAGYSLRRNGTEVVWLCIRMN